MSYYSSGYNSGLSRGAIIGWLIGAAVAIAAVIFFSNLWGWNIYILRSWFVSGTGQAVFLLILSVLAIIAVFVFTGFKFEIIWPGFVVFVAAAVIWAIIGFNAAHSTQVLYLSSADITQKTSTEDYDQRVPFEIAVNQVDKNMGDSTGTSTDVKSIASEGEFGLWNTLIVRRGVGVGYEGVISIDSPTYGNVDSADVERCYFDEQKANLRLGGFLPENDLGRAVLGELFWTNVNMNYEDAYGYCSDGTPQVVMPLVTNEGYLFQKAVPWGLALYNGKTGELTITQDADEIAAVPGPTYPISVARAQREALQSYNGDWWDHIQGLLGWDTVGNAEVQLRYSDSGIAEYFTALQPRGASASVVAEARVDSRMLTPGSFNTIEVEKLEAERAANETIADTITNQYSYMPEFSGDKYQVYEIVPGKAGGWVASVGTDQSVVYRVLIDATGSKLELIDRDGNVVTASGGTNSEGEPTVTFDGNIEGLSEAELLELLGEVTDRLQEINATE